MNKTKIPIGIALLAAIIYFLELKSIISIGKLINHYFPCKQEPLNSLPCYGIYDIYFMVLLGFVFVVTLMVIGFRIYKNKNRISSE